MDKTAKFKTSLIEMQPSLHSFAMRLTADKEASCDLVQETTLKVLSNAEKFVDNTNFKGWVLTIMRNIFINSYRKATREKTIIDTTDNLFHLNLPQESGIGSPEGTYAEREIKESIAKFPASYREPFNLHVAGYKYEEISKILNMPLGTVKSRIFITRKQLRIMLKDYH